MIKTLTERGNGWLLNIPKTILKLLGLNPQTSEVQLKIKDKTLYVQEIFPDNPDYEKYLVKPLSKKNSTYGIYMSNTILELLDINPEKDKVKLEIEENILIVKKFVET